MTNTHIIEVFVHEDEAKDEKSLPGSWRGGPASMLRSDKVLSTRKNYSEKQAPGRGRDFLMPVQ